MNNINETHDLDIDNYNLTDLLNLFHLQFDFNENDLKRAKLMVYKMHPDKSNIDNKYFIFFNKAYKTIQKVYYFKRKKQQNSYDTEYSYFNNNVCTNVTNSFLCNKIILPDIYLQNSIKLLQNCINCYKITYFYYKITYFSKNIKYLNKF